ncbi:gamma-glutamylcyclotransferase family protein [Pelagibacterium sp.]|uniref:gamma-glutamylcyclotransferase family protein n=1 Tax=Pelagibacterium sp. TaxID=1967288 RepID=UPI003A94527B
MNTIDPPLFVYGTLRDREIFEGVLGRRVAAEALNSARAYGWRTIYYGHNLYPALVAANEWVAGLLVTDLSRNDMVRLDIFEGDEYRRSTLEIHVESGTATAQTYLPVRQIDPDGPRWSFANWTKLHRRQAIPHHRLQEFNWTPE